MRQHYGGRPGAWTGAAVISREAMLMEDYLQLPRESSSGLVLFSRDPAQYAALKAGKMKREDKPHFTLGSYVHDLRTDPLRVADRYIVAPSRLQAKQRELGDPDAFQLVDRRTAHGKAVWAEFEAAIGTRKVIDPATGDLAHRMVDAMEIRAGALFDLVNFWEHTVLWDHMNPDGLHLPMKARFDGVAVDAKRIVEIKTDMDPQPNEPSAWRWYRWGYHIRAAVYFEAFEAAYGMQAESVDFVVVESAADRTGPYGNTLEPRVAHLRCAHDSPAHTVGKIEFHRLVTDLAEARFDDDWRSPWEREQRPFPLPRAVARQYGIDPDELELEGVVDA